jgi:tetratricopeptide (TPR) repeat protein/O-antigen ligase
MIRRTKAGVVRQQQTIASRARKYLRYLLLVYLYSVPFVALVQMPDALFPAIDGKVFAFRVATEVAFVFYFVLALLDADYRPRLSSINAAVIALVLWMGISTIFAADPMRSFWGSFERMDGLVTLKDVLFYFLIATAVLRTENDWHVFFAVSVAVSLIVGWEAIAVDISPLSPASVIRTYRASATFGNPTYLAAFMMFNLFFSLYLIARIPRPELATRQNLFISLCLCLSCGLSVFAPVLVPSDVLLPTELIVTAILLAFLLRLGKSAIPALLLNALAVQLVCLILSGSRGPILAAAVGIFVVLAVAIAHPISFNVLRQTTLRLPRLSIRSLAFLSGVIILGIVAGLISEIAQPFQRLISFSYSDASVAVRPLVWTIAVLGIVERPIFGWGLENFPVAFDKHYDPRLFALEQWFDKPHNVFLEWAVCGGLPALFLICFGIAAAVRSLYRTQVLRRWTSATMIGALSAYLVHALVGFDNLLNTIYLLSLLGFAHSAGRPTIGKCNTADMAGPWLYTMIGVGIVLTGLGVYFCNIPDIRTSVDLESVLLSTSSASAKPLLNAVATIRSVIARDDLRRQETAMAIVQSNLALRNRDPWSVDAEAVKRFSVDSINALSEISSKGPPDVRIEYHFGRLLNTLGRYGEAEARLLKALALSPSNHMIMFELGLNTYFRSHQYDKALAMFRRVYELNKTFSDGRIGYAIGLYATHEEQVADKLLMEGFGTLIPDNTALLDAYNELGYFSRAAAMLERRLDATPQDAQSRILLATVKAEAFDKRGAISEIRKAAQYDPTVASQLNNYVELFRNGPEPNFMSRFDFSSDTARAFLTEGWGESEPWGKWMSSEKASLILPAQYRAITGLQLETRISPTAKHRVANLGVAVGGCRVANVHFDDNDGFQTFVVANVPAGCTAANDPIKVELTVSELQEGVESKTEKGLGLAGLGVW